MTTRHPSTAEPAADRVCLGVITGVHGIRGAVRIKSFAAEPEDIAAYGPLEDQSGSRQFAIQLIGAGKGVLLAQLDGVDDRDRAESLRGLRLYLPRAALPPVDDDEYYHADLIGLDAMLADRTPIGRVRAIFDFGAGDMLEIERPGTSPVLVPFTRVAVPVVDMATRRLVIDPPAGLLGTESESAEAAENRP